MTFRLAVIIGCTATLGFTALASASASPAGSDAQKFERAKLVHVAATKPKYMRSGISTSSSDSRPATAPATLSSPHRRSRNTSRSEESASINSPSRKSGSLAA